MELFMCLDSYNLNNSEDHQRFMHDVIKLNGLSVNAETVRLYDRAWDIIATHYGSTAMPVNVLMEIICVVWDLAEMEG